MKRIEAGLIRKAMAEPWEKLGFALTLNLLTLTISFFSGTLWLLFFASLIIDCLDRLPEDGEEVTLENGIHLKVQGIDQNRIIKVLMTIPEPNEEHVEHSSETSENHE